MSKTNPDEIRPARPDEADFLSDLAIQSKAYWDYSDEFIDACREELSYRPEQIQSSNMLFSVVEHDGIVIGFYAIAKNATPQFDLEALFVNPDHIGQGIGKALLIHAKQLASDEGGQSLSIQGDPNAESFYLAAGASKIGQRESGSIPGRFLPMFSIQLG